MSHSNPHYQKPSDNDSYLYDESLFSDTDVLSNHNSVVQDFKTVFVPCMYCIICFFGLVGNSLVLVVLTVYEKLKTPTDIFLVNLATADILFLCTLPFLAYSALNEWIFGNVMCKVIMGMYNINLYTFMLTLTCITVDRFIAIAQATKAHRLQIKMKTWVKFICFAVWTTAILLSVPQIAFFEEVPKKKLCILVYNDYDIYLTVRGFQMTVGFFIPLVAMVICYSLIIRTIIHARGLQKRKSLKIIFAIVAVFIGTQLPYNLMSIVHVTEVAFELNPRFQVALILTEAVAHIHACLNPILYFFIGAKFRKNVWKIIKGAKCAKHSQEGSSQVKSTEEQSKTIYASNSAEATSMHRLSTFR